MRLSDLIMKRDNRTITELQREEYDAFALVVVGFFAIALVAVVLITQWMQTIDTPVQKERIGVNVEEYR